MESTKGTVNCFTVDLEEWFQGLTSTNPQVERWPQFESRVVPATDLLLEILRAYNVKATFFVLGHVADHHPQLIERIGADGHELGIHGYYHRFVHRMTRDEFAHEIEQSCRALERLTGQLPRGHRAPYFSVNSECTWAFDVLQDFGIRYDSSVFPTRNMLYGFPEAPRFVYRPAGSNLVEFPASTVRLAGRNWPMAGGFYMRALPYGVTRRAIRRLNKQGEGAILYIHPWELDTEQHYTDVTPRERITHYHGRHTVEAKLHKLFSDFTFAPMNELYLQFRRAEPAPATGAFMPEPVLARVKG